ncbi:phosphotransferase [Streptomyces sp. NBC_01387]|uniref:phosphotransferase n=1 Tax=unclassified Streptomyces TaxID=2593676 RepID=UPI002023F477|nr:MULTISPECIES: phosphotransferase [unclassified Streptomyces]MCX4549700.1 phosphotransferase [Streptomyces sp. NBC_01500]WSC21226.1 phosphotransferase [Streptomyces sp. NBC_01766]WSV55162.1 phosphotransferase [Streptomyces sp. NBC_01014]
MPRSYATPPVKDLLRRYGSAGSPLSCEPVAQGLLNRGYRLATTHGDFFLKHHLDGDPAAISRQHRATQRLQALGVPVAPPLADTDGDTVTVLGGRCYALHPWIDGRHRDGAQLSTAGSQRLGALLGLVHTGLEQVMEAETAPPEHESADPSDTFDVIDALLGLAGGRSARDTFDELAEHRLRERRRLLERHAHRRPPPGTARGWVHGDFHPLNLLYRGAEPAAIIDWDRLGVKPRAEEVVRAAVIFFVQPTGELELAKVRAYARAYRRAAAVCATELAAAVHRVWWERLNDFWILRWRYQLHDRRADPLFPAASALVVWWTREYEAVCEAFAS